MSTEFKMPWHLPDDVTHGERVRLEKCQTALSNYFKCQPKTYLCVPMELYSMWMFEGLREKPYPETGLFFMNHMLWFAQGALMPVVPEEYVAHFNLLKDKKKHILKAFGTYAV